MRDQRTHGPKTVISNRPLRFCLLVVMVVVVSGLHYVVPVSELKSWSHPILQLAYFIPLLLGSLWYGWRRGITLAGLASVLYIPHIAMAWEKYPAYRAAQYINILIFFAITIFVGVLADRQRAEQWRAKKSAHLLAAANADLQSSFEQLRRADRLSALGELSAGLAHEIRNPLGAVEAAVRVLGRPEASKETRQEFSQSAQVEIDRLKTLVDKFLDLARPQKPSYTSAEPLTILNSVVQLAHQTARTSRVQIRVEASDSLPLIWVDTELMKQVLLNLVINAIQAMPNGGEVLLRALIKASALELQVRDQGVGIVSADVERMFDPFYTTRPIDTGLGLSISYRIVNQHGGHIAAYSNSEGGMTFAVSLPLRRELLTDDVTE